MPHAVHRWNRLYTIYQLSGCSSISDQSISCKLEVLNYLKFALKMKRVPPIGAFKLNPLRTSEKLSIEGDELTPNCNPDITNIKDMDIVTGRVDIKPVSQQISNKANMADAKSSVFTTAGVNPVEKVDSGVMMKMIVSGPPSQVKRQKILPDTLLQKVTDIVRQQTMNKDVTIPREMKDKLLEEETNDRIKDAMSENDTEKLKLNSATYLNTHDNSIKAQNSNQNISQSIAQSADNKLFESEFTHTVDVQYSKQTKDLSVNESLTNMNATVTLALCESCNGLDYSVETGDSFTNKTLVNNRETKSIERIEQEFETFGEFEEKYGSPHSDELGSALTEVEKEETQRNANETEISPLGNLFSGEVGDVYDTVELDKEACRKCISDTEVDPFVGLFLENETDSWSDKKTSKDSKISADEIYNIAPLFSGELERWRKRELKKDKKKTWKKKKGKPVRKDPGETGDDKGDKERKTKNRPIPNYFVAIQITNPKIHAGIRHVQEDVVSGNEKLKPALNKLATLHLTMFVVHLQTDDEMARAKLAMDQCQKRLESLYPNKLLSLDVDGLGNFRNSVVFAKVRSEEQINKLREIADIVEDCFLDHEIVSTEKSGSFKPHITVMKLTRDKSFRKKGGIKKIDEALYKEHMDASFGQQHVNTLQLCAMLKKKADSGYYQVEHCVQFGPDIGDIADTESNDKIGLEEMVADSNAKDQEEEHIKRLLDELINNITDSDNNKTFCDGKDPNFLKSNRTEGMESIDSDRIAQKANDVNQLSQDTQDTDKEKETISSDSGTVKLKASVSTVDKTDRIESIVGRDFDITPVQHNANISRPGMQEPWETNVICDRQIDLISPVKEQFQSHHVPDAVEVAEDVKDDGSIDIDRNKT